MKRLIAALLLAAVAITFSTPALSAASIKYREIGPLSFCTGCAAITGQTDSTSKYMNAATANDTSAVYAWPNDIIWGAVSDSLPIMVRVTRTAAGAATDSVYVALQTAYGGGTGTGSGIGTVPASFVANGWDFSQLAQIGATAGGMSMFYPGRLRTNTLGPISLYSVPANSYGSALFRVIARSVSTVQASTKFSVFVRYPISAQ
jgi:hypothetical protein